MSRDLSHVEFSAKVYRGGHWPATMDELIDGWIGYQIAFQLRQEAKKDEMFWAFDAAVELCQGYPDLALKFVMEVLEKGVSERTPAVLAAGPLEELLAHHGPKIIDRIENIAKENPEFRLLLGGVWQNRMSDQIWQRVIKASSDRW